MTVKKREIPPIPVDFEGQDSVYVIAEAGVNHNGDEKLAYQLIDAASEGGADAVKFQLFSAREIVTASAAKAAYQIQDGDLGESQLKMLRSLELTHDTFRGLKVYCSDKGIEFLATAFDDQSLKFLIEDLDVSALKIASGEINNGPFLLAHARSNKKIILSTGMSNLQEIERALGILAFGFVGARNPSQEAFQSAYRSEKGKQYLKEKVTLLHCVSSYPAPITDTNLRVMDLYFEQFGLFPGLSDHSLGTTIAIAAAAKGAKIIEKHLTLDRNLNGPDHLSSIEPQEMKEMVSAIRVVENALGKAEKQVQLSERDVLKVARKLLVASVDIQPGEVLSPRNVTTKRSDKGLDPMCYWELMGTVSERKYYRDEPIEM